MTLHLPKRPSARYVPKPQPVIAPPCDESQAIDALLDDVEAHLARAYELLDRPSNVVELRPRRPLGNAATVRMAGEMIRLIRKEISEADFLAVLRAEVDR